VASDVNIRRYERTDEAEAIRLLVEKLPPAERDGAFDRRLLRWKWQYYENPSNPEGEPLIWVAQVGDEFGGMVCTIPVKVRTPIGPVLGMWGVDFVVDPRMRSMGIGKKLLEAWIRTPGIAFVRGWSPVSFRVATGVGFELIWGFPSAKIVLSRFRYGAALLKESKRRELVNLAKVCLLSNRLSRSGSDSISVGDEIPAGTDNLWAEVSKRYPFAVERDMKYLKWRFTGHPTHRYQFISLHEGGELAGLGIVRLTEGDPPVGVVSDLIVSPGRRELLLDLAAESLRFLKSQGACAALVDLSPAIAPLILDEYRCSVRQEFGMIIRTDDERLKEAGIFKIESWFQGRSDADEDY
jgi:GNAT superfamily N-acetyltransferase